MTKSADILEGLSEATPAFRRYARALGAGAGLVVADGVVQAALQGLGARMRAREICPTDREAARVEAYAAITALAARKFLATPGPGPRQPPIVHGLSRLHVDERAVLLLICLEGFGYEAVARIVGASRESVFVRLQRARLAMADWADMTNIPADTSATRNSAHLRVVK